MQANTKYLILYSFFFLSLITTNSIYAQEQFKQAEFKNPSDSVKIHSWWHWLDGNVTKDGITQDLEAMKKQGIVQATILNVGLFRDKDFGVNRISFNTPEWFEMFNWALHESNRLGISIGMHNCDGWSTSGGPWITPELSMQQYVWTKTIINASQKEAITLKRPIANHDFYSDVAVVAMRSDKPKSSFQRNKPVIKFRDYKETYYLFDGCTSSDLIIKPGDSITFSFKEDFTAEKIAIMPRKDFIWRNPGNYISTYRLLASNDGQHYEQISEFTIAGLNKLSVLSFKTTTAKFFRLTLESTNNLNDWLPLSIAECELLEGDDKALYSNEIEYLPEKSVNVKAADSINLYSYFLFEKNDVKEVVNLTSKMNNNGTLDWKPEEGNWAIFRFGHTTTGAINVPATKTGRGLECNKMDTTALNIHFNSFPKKLIDKAGPFTGNTFKFMLIDSWEAEFQNWTPGMLHEFEKRRGYSLIDFIPVLCGESSGNTGVDEAVLYDLRRTIADLIEDYYYKHFADLLHKYNMELHAEVIYGGTNCPPLDILKTTQYVDLPMFEFWSATDENQNIAYSLVRGPELNMPACAIIGYDKPILGSEAYTGYAHYSETPANLKPFGDNAYCAGINQMILHSYVHQPHHKKPGMTLGRWGSPFNRNNSYWPYISEWFNYQSRIQYILQKGVAFHDVLYFIGDQLPQTLSYNQSNTLPFGYRFNTCNFDILQNRIEVSDNKLILNRKVSYSVLTLSSGDINFKTLKRIEELVKEGIVLYAPKPQRMLSLYDIKNHQQEFNTIVNELWGKCDGKIVFTHDYGKGKVYWGIPLAEVLKTEKILPDIQTQDNDSTNLLFIHKKTDNDDVYFVMNQLDSTLHREISFRVSGKVPEIWDPETASTVKPAVYHTDKNYTLLPVTLKPYQSLLFIFKDEKPTHYLQCIKQNGNQIFPAIDSPDKMLIPCIVNENNELVVTSSQLEGDFELIDNKRNTHTLKLHKEKEHEISDFTGTIKFSPEYIADIQPVDFDTLHWLTESKKPDIKYFTGTAKYVIHFSLPDKRILKEDLVFLDIGAFETIADVKLNGIDLGVIWKPGKYLPVKGVLTNKNILEVYVANTFRNRFIGDFVQCNEIKNLWTSAPVAQFLQKDSPLKPSGLKGPIKIITKRKY